MTQPVATHRAYIGIGANLGDAQATVRCALGALERLGRVTRRSSLYGSPPWGKLDQPDFVNAVAALETALAPQALLAALQALERELGRTPGPRWGARAIDLDILTYDDARIDEPGLQIPHRYLRERAFALVPLAEIDPAWIPARDARADRGTVVRLGPSSDRADDR